MQDCITRQRSSLQNGAHTGIQREQIASILTIIVMLSGESGAAFSRKPVCSCTSYRSAGCPISASHKMASYLAVVIC